MVAPRSGARQNQHMDAAFKTTRRVQFHETDCAGIAHFSSFFTYMEEAEHEMLRQFGLRIFHETEDETISWPRVSAACDFRNPIRFEDMVDIEVRIVERTRRSITYGFLFSCEGRRIAEGRMTSVCCRMTDSGPRATEIPGWIIEKLPPVSPNTGPGEEDVSEVL
jgi:4-hydroxybenzoyl-CoA thioesterase/acyl-CoA thioester hydrolase